MQFLQNEEGAVTVDWVVLTAGLVGLGLATLSVVSSGVGDLTNDTSEALSNEYIISTNFTPGQWYYSDRTGAYSAVMSLYENNESHDVSWYLTNGYSDFINSIEADEGVDDASEFLDEYAAAVEITLAQGGSLPEGNMTAQEAEAHFLAMYPDG